MSTDKMNRSSTLETMTSTLTSVITKVTEMISSPTTPTTISEVTPFSTKSTTTMMAMNSTGGEMENNTTQVMNSTMKIVTSAITSMTSSLTSTPAVTSPTTESANFTTTSFNDTGLSTISGMENDTTTSTTSTISMITTAITSMINTNTSGASPTTIITDTTMISSTEMSSTSTNVVITSWLNINNPLFIMMLVLSIIGLLLIVALITVMVIYCSKRKPSRRVPIRKHSSGYHGQLKGRYSSLLTNDHNGSEGQVNYDVEDGTSANNNDAGLQKLTTFQKSASAGGLEENKRSSAADAELGNAAISTGENSHTAEEPVRVVDSMGPIYDLPPALDHTVNPIYDVPPARDHTTDSVDKNLSQDTTAPTSLPEPPPDPRTGEDNSNEVTEL